jgi:hypothetical protein
MNLIDIVSLVVQCITSMAILLAAWQILFHARQMHRDLEMQYVKQFWTIFANTSTNWRLTNFRGKPETDSDRRAIVDYLQLCEDEVELRRSARVTDSTWILWASAISSMMKLPPFRDVLDQADAELYPELRALLSSASPAQYDPLTRGRLWRRFRGL